jgi:hypothetical protein
LAEEACFRSRLGDTIIVKVSVASGDSKLMVEKWEDIRNPKFE